MPLPTQPKRSSSSIKYITWHHFVQKTAFSAFIDRKHFITAIFVAFSGALTKELMCVCVDTHKLNFIYTCVIHFQVIHELKLLPFVVKDVEQKVKSFRFYSDEVIISDSNTW